MTSHMNQVAIVIVPVSDQERALAFYAGTLGFETRVDFEYGDGERWIEVAPPGAATRLTLAPGPAGIETRVIFTTEDVDAAHADLGERGVDVDTAILRDGDPPVVWGGAVQAGTPPMFRLRDPDGNSYLVVQQV